MPAIVLFKTVGRILAEADIVSSLLILKNVNPVIAHVDDWLRGRI